MAYAFGNEINEQLLEIYEKIELESKKQEAEKAIEELNRLKKRLRETQENPAEYILNLEKNIKNLEKDQFQLFEITEKNSNLKEHIGILEKETQNLTQIIEETKTEIKDKVIALEQFKQQYFDDFKKAEEVHYSEIEELKLKHKQELEYQEEQFNKKIRDFNDHIQKLNNDIDDHKKEFVILHKAKEDDKIQHEKDIKLLNKDIEELDVKVKQERAKYFAVKQQNGLITEEDDFTSKEKFKEMELEMQAYKKFFKDQWKKTRIKIKSKVKNEIEIMPTIDESEIEDFKNNN